MLYLSFCCCVGCVLLVCLQNARHLFISQQPTPIPIEDVKRIKQDKVSHLVRYATQTALHITRKLQAASMLQAQVIRKSQCACIHVLGLICCTTYVLCSRVLLWLYCDKHFPKSHMKVLSQAANNGYFGLL
jgi:hypothetical protein